MADCQDDCQRRRPPVRSRQPRQVRQGTKPHSVSFLCSDLWDVCSSCLSVSFCLSAAMTPLRIQRTVTPWRRWPHQWQTIHMVLPATNCITLRTKKAFYHLLNHSVCGCGCVCVCTRLGEWLFTHGLMENLKCIHVPVFKLHNTIKEHV